MSTESQARVPVAERTSLGGAISRGFRYYAVFSGTASRTEFWFFALFTFLGSLFLAILTFVPSIELQILIAVLSWLWLLGTLLPTLALFARRLRDAGFHPALMLLLLVPIAGLGVLIMCMMSSKEQPNTAQWVSGEVKPNPTDLAGKLEELEKLHSDGLIDAKQLKDAKNKALGI